METYKIYYPQKDNATEYYLHIIQKAIEKNGNNVEYINTYDSINTEDIVITIDAFPFFKIRKKKPKKIINWFQGIAPEEKLRFDSRNRLYIYLIYIVHSWLEKYALRKADLCFFVSNSMKKHYEKKYGYKNNSYLIMPCFNTKIDDSSFTDEKYRNPTFLYSGNTSGWQRVPETIALFKHIKETIIPNAELVIYTPNKDVMQKLLDEQGVEAKIGFVHYSQLNEEIKKYKYGFLIREDVDVNNVATPTKMNSYIASGIIPIYSNVLGDFKEEFKNLKYSISLGNNYEGLDKILEIERLNINSNDVKNDFQTIFDKYYNEDYYINIIADRLKAL